jgi:hypothetical protein
MNDLSRSPTSYEDVIRNQQKHQINSECDKKNEQDDFDDKQLNSEMKINESDSESESEIDLTTNGSPKDFVLVNGCIDFSNNNNNNNNNNSDK